MEPSIRRVSRSKDVARESYNRLSRWYDLLAGGTEKKYRNGGLEMLSARPGERILEIGVGTGHCLVALARAVGPTGHLIGVDVSDGMLAVAKGRLRQSGWNGQVDLYPADASKLDFLTSESMDGVFISFTLELFDTPEIPCVLQECRRLLKTGGRLVVVSMSKTESVGIMVRIYEWFHDHIPSIADCRPILVRQSIEQNGFTVEDIRHGSMLGLPVEIVLARKL